MLLTSGARLGPYEILSFVGAGGMGEVYKARDTRLDRIVAIKILRGHLAADSERSTRFEREARLLSQLNHPRICALYDLGQQDGATHLVLEWLEGETLAARLDRSRGRGLPWPDTLAIATQIAEALNVLHRRGIVHRDLKPANVMLTGSGTARPGSPEVKLLDFGIAKAGGVPSAGGDANAGTAPPTSLPTVTIEGTLLGTLQYMAPEQLEGRDADTRSDLFAFGAVVYEMLAGRPAFAGDSQSSVIAAVLDSQPPPIASAPSPIPPALEHVVRTCLAKDPDERWQSAGDVQRQLEWIGGLQSQGARETQKPRGGHAVAILVCAALIVVVGALLATILRRPRPASAGIAPAHVTAAQLTSYAGRQYAPALAPDGRSFVFVSTHMGSPDIWLRQVSGGEPVRLTNDAFEEGDLAFAPDGESIYFTRVDDRGEGIWQVGVLGGQPRKLIANGHSVAPSPDGRTLAYMTAEAGDASESLVVSMLDGSATSTLAQHVPAFPRGRPAWSRDGRFVSYVRAGLFAPANLFIVDIEGKNERQITHFTRPVEGVQHHVWLPDNRHLVVSYVPYSRTQVANDLALLKLDDGSVTRITTTIADNLLAPSISSDGSRLIATAAGLVREVWKVPLTSTDPDVNGRAAVRLIEATQDPLWIFVPRNGRTLLYNSLASGSRNLWIAPLDGNSTPRQVTAASGDSIGHSSLSPDGTRLAFVSFAGGASDIWTQNVDGTDLKQLTNDPAPDNWPVWSPDGRSIVFSTVRDGAPQTWVVPSEGGASRKLIDGVFRGDWVEQPEHAGTWIVTPSSANGVRLIDVENERIVWEERVTGAAPSLPVFSPDRRSISVAIQAGHDRQLEVGNRAATADAVAILDVATRQQRIAVRLPFRIVFRAGWTDAGMSLIVNRNDPTSRIVMFDGLWERESR